MQPHDKGVNSMSWRLVVFIVVFGVFLAFITFNLDNRCDINFGFATIEGVPVFLTVFFSFVLGLLCTLPLAVSALKKRKVTAEKDHNDDKIRNNMQERRSLFQKKHGYSPSDGGHNAAN